ncbi:MAG: protein SCO1/2 [Ulvibacter sp.]|jgi:protein SCO1/2
MKTFSIKTFSLLVIICTAIGCDSSERNSRVETLPYYDSADFTPRWIEYTSSKLQSFHTIPEFSLTNQDNELITEKTFENKIYITDFFFTFCTGICPKMTDNMSLLQEEFKNDESVLLLSHSVTPDHDTTEVLQEYADAKEIISGKWHLVTGDRQEIYDLGRTAYFVEEDLGLEKEADDFLHTENFVLIDQNRHIRGIYNGLNKTAITQLITDIKTLKQEL